MSEYEQFKKGLADLQKVGISCNEVNLTFFGVPIKWITPIDYVCSSKDENPQKEQ